jgi:hypothetical protein
VEEREEGMIVFERYGHIFRIRNDDWKNLRRRFNTENATLVDDKYWINISCSLCKRYKSNMCINCPLEKLKTELNYGCTLFFGKLLRKREFDFYTTHIKWHKRIDEKVRGQLNRMQKIMDKIEKENQNETKTKLTHKG